MALNHLITNRIVENRDDLLRVVCSLKLGKLSASEMIRTMQAGKRSFALAKAIAGVGPITKTMCLLNYIDDASYDHRFFDSDHSR